ncbi:uncharacterized protein LOC111700628 isoform X1 [Eurytemora carolleeae]|uniref:uncharacterized protein LOC111700628 isoform X1 n=1 Tax=Eurytemora carolleeae TaxID=1294199 RepID=UPI000C75834B|nr:uncharacterized protein LOC111700628 isoform X1 [Eurytemora carolleeae]|eukprot:XP_023327377.1 uncharacterized protein LOC111700628 isoform X1 [Eurytemora affinis]
MKESSVLRIENEEIAVKSAPSMKEAPLVSDSMVYLAMVLITLIFQVYLAMVLITLIFQVYLAMVLITLIALIVTGVKIQIVDSFQDADNGPTFKPLQQQVRTNIMYTGNGFMPPDHLFFHSQGEISDRANLSIRILKSGRTVQNP